MPNDILSPGHPAVASPDLGAVPGARGLFTRAQVEAALAAHRRGERPYRRLRPAAAKERAFVAALYLGGLPMRDIAAYVDRQFASVYRWVHASGIDVAAVVAARGDWRTRPELGARVYALRVTRGLPWAEVADKIGVADTSRGWLRAVLAAHCAAIGVEPPKPHARACYRVAR